MAPIIRLAIGKAEFSSKKCHGIGDDTRPRQHVPGTRAIAAGEMARPIDAITPRMRADSAFGIHHMKLARGLPTIGAGEKANDVLCRRARFEQGEPAPTIKRVRQRLGRERAHPSAQIGDAAADGEELRRDRDRRLPRSRIARYDRPSHARIPLRLAVNALAASMRFSRKAAGFLQASLEGRKTRNPFALVCGTSRCTRASSPIKIGARRR
jgi:hypothetical protein